MSQQAYFSSSSQVTSLLRSHLSVCQSEVNLSVFSSPSWIVCQWNTFVALRSKTFSWANGNLFLLCLSPLSKQEEARAEYKRLKREMMETKRKKDIEEEKRPGEIFLVNFHKFTWVSLLQAFRWWGEDWIVRAGKTKGAAVVSRQFVARALSTIWTPGTGYTWVGSVTMHRIVKMPWWRNKKAITEQKLKQLV